MTANQIAFFRAREEARANRASEAHKMAELTETTRHNVVGEGELSRHNVVSEGIAAGTLSLQNKQHLETQRSNIAREQEAHRHNVVTEGISRADLQSQDQYRKGMVSSSIISSKAQQLNAEVNARNVKLTDVRESNKLLESVRHNREMESQGVLSLTNSLNTAMARIHSDEYIAELKSETDRYGTDQRARTASDQLSEQSRHNRVSERIDALKTAGSTTKDIFSSAGSIFGIFGIGGK